MKKKIWLIPAALAATLCLCFGIAACEKEPSGVPADGPQAEQNGGTTTPDDGNGEEPGGNGGEQKPDDNQGNQGGQNDPNVPIAQLYLNTKQTSVFIGGTLTLQVTVFPKNATEKIAWTSTAPDVASVAQDGTVSGVGEGTATIIASNSAGTVSDSCTVTVSENTNGFIFEEYGNGYTVKGYKGTETAVSIPQSYHSKPVIAIGDGTQTGGFANQSAIESVEIPSSVVTICSYAFYNCVSLQELVVPDTVTNIQNSAFMGCVNLTSVTIGSGVTSIGEVAFKGCSRLESITIPFVGNGFEQTHFGYLFGANTYNDNSACVPTSLRKVTITGGESIGDDSFYQCSGLAEITIPDSVTSIGKEAFSGCSGLESIVIPFVGNGSDKTHFGYLFGASTYESNSESVPASLKNVTITGGAIGDYAFNGCSGLESVTIPDSVTLIGERAFEGCSNLTIYCEASSQPAGWNTNWNPDGRPVEWGYKNN